MTSKNYKFFKYAKHMAEMSDYTKTQVGCVAVYKNKVLGVGFSTNKTSPLQMRYNYYRSLGDGYIQHKCHAETVALSNIMDLDINWSKVDLYVYRKCKSREHGLARPCSACYAMIKELKIRNIYYTTDDGYQYERVV